MIRRLLTRWTTPHRQHRHDPTTIHARPFTGGAEVDIEDWLSNLFTDLRDNDVLADALADYLTATPADPYAQGEALPLEHLLRLITPTVRIYGPRVGVLAGQLAAIAEQHARPVRGEAA